MAEHKFILLIIAMGAIVWINISALRYLNIFGLVVLLGSVPFVMMILNMIEKM